MQLVPYGWKKSNPPVTAGPVAERRGRGHRPHACYDCHSNETEWPVYSYVAPMSWLVRKDVEGGRGEMNFSEWDEDSADAAEDAGEEIIEGRMPLPNYRRIHRDAELSDEEAAILIDALEQMSEDDDDDDGHEVARRQPRPRELAERLVRVQRVVVLLHVRIVPSSSTNSMW